MNAPDWRLLGTPAGAAATPADLPRDGWQPAVVPGTVAQALDLPLDTDPRLDDRDWWYCTRLSLPDEGGPQALHFEGLATIAEVWVDGTLAARSRNMFRPLTVPLPQAPAVDLAICFRALTPVLRAFPRRPRPRWQTNLVDEQNLRHVRTSLLGRIPGWTPPLPAVGPWRPVRLRPAGQLQRTDLHLRTWAESGRARLHIRVPAAGELRLADTVHPLESGDNDVTLDAPIWWPRGMGPQSLVAAVVALADGRTVDLGRIGFRSLSFDGLQPVVNGVPVFCRGACWTVADVRAVDGSPQAIRSTLQAAVDAGLNMLRVGGTMTWPSDALLDACDALGVLLWQDAMLANMDVPLHDAGYFEELTAETDHHLRRLQGRPCATVLCGGSEVAQQAAMMGQSPGPSDFADRWLPERAAELLPDVAVHPSSPTGGPLPFHTRTGPTHYFGVGAYLRPLSDARRADVGFAGECLAFANVPEDSDLQRLPRGATTPPHHPDWKAGVPRDNGAGWDFDDVRDHYLRELFGLDPLAVRYADADRYRRLSRQVTAEVCQRTFAEWRRPASGCAGALVWFLRDLRPGAGWGVLDSSGQPKPVLAGLRRAWAPRAVLLTDEGLDGVDVHVHNESPHPMTATVELLTIHALRGKVHQSSKTVNLTPFSSTTISGEGLLGGFADPTHAYRFGPAAHHAVAARLHVDGELIHEDVLIVGSHDLPLLPASALSAAFDPETSVLTLKTDQLVQGVTIEAKGYQPEHSHFHLTPGERQVKLQPTAAVRRFKAWVTGLNLDGGLTVR